MDGVAERWVRSVEMTDLREGLAGWDLCEIEALCNWIYCRVVPPHHDRMDLNGRKLKNFNALDNPGVN